MNYSSSVKTEKEVKSLIAQNNELHNPTELLAYSLSGGQ